MCQRSASAVVSTAQMSNHPHESLRFFLSKLTWNLSQIRLAPRLRKTRPNTPTSSAGSKEKANFHAPLSHNGAIRKHARLNLTQESKSFIKRSRGREAASSCRQEGSTLVQVLSLTVTPIPSRWALLLVTHHLWHLMKNTCVYKRCPHQTKTQKSKLYSLEGPNRPICSNDHSVSNHTLNKSEMITHLTGLASNRLKRLMGRFTASSIRWRWNPPQSNKFCSRLKVDISKRRLNHPHLHSLSKRKSDFI